MVEETLNKHDTTYFEICKKVVYNVSTKTVKRRINKSILKNGLHKRKLIILNEDLAQKRLEWALDNRNWRREMGRRKALWENEVSVEICGGKRRKLVFRYPNEKQNKDCINPTTRTGEREICQIMIAFFIVKLMVFFYLFFLILLLLRVE